ncbi:MAG: sulfatase-like hydrolase/transferase [Thermoplasmata archaeon]|nr:sulfatase-like hydrolase/transferase [Thermoplasmata archaeon]
MPSSTGRDRPNLLLVVLDCVRASDFPGGAQAVGPTPFLDRLRAESVDYPKAASVAHWTVPAHASMFTGLYPWEHGVHAKGLLKLDARGESVGALLRSSGYHTLSISANGLISPALGLVDGIDRSAWGVSLFNRFGTGALPPKRSDNGHGPPPQPVGRGPLSNLSYWAAVMLARYPGTWDFPTRLAMRLRHRSDGARARLANWLEPTAGRWLKEAPADRPVYCFVNLLDAHEPYLAEPEVVHSLRSWWEYARTRQDRLGWVTGKWKPTAREYELLHELYRTMVQSLDRRVEGVVNAFRDSGRWENTTMILTSDHGQAFGEHSALFHIVGVDEPELRVPLSVRFAGRRHAGTTAQGWASLIDVYATLLGEAGVPLPDRPSRPVSLEQLLDRPRSDPVYAMSDGLVHAADRNQVPGPRREMIDRLLVAGYEGEYKIVHDPVTDGIRAFRPDGDPAEALDVSTTHGPELAALAEGVREIGRRILTGPESQLPSDVEERLRSWGYI